jgi:HEAT repeat protein
LMDRSAPIRRECQAVVAKRFAFPAADFYRARLLVPHARQIEVAVLGISETGGPKDAGAMITLLDHWSVRVRRAAIRAARTVGAKVSSVLLLNTIALDRPSVVREAVLALLAERMISAESIWAATTKNPDHRARIAALNALQIADKWTQIRLYLDAAADAEPSLSRRAVELIGLWVRKFNTTFTQPTTEDKIAVSSALAAIKNFLPNELSRELMFIVQTSLR